MMAPALESDADLSGFSGSAGTRWTPPRRSCWSRATTICATRISSA